MDAEATPISIGDLEGWTIRAAMKPGADAACEMPGMAFSMIRWHDGIPVTAGLGDEASDVVVLDGHHGRTMAISNRITEGPLVDEATAIVESLEFSS